MFIQDYHASQALIMAEARRSELAHQLALAKKCKSHHAEQRPVRFRLGRRLVDMMVALDDWLHGPPVPAAQCFEGVC
jgi:hypothetical protein